MIRIEQYKVDGETRLSLYLDDEFMEEVDCHSQFTPKQARSYLKEKYRNGRLN